MMEALTQMPPLVLKSVLGSEGFRGLPRVNFACIKSGHNCSPTSQLSLRRTEGCVFVLCILLRELRFG